MQGWDYVKQTVNSGPSGNYLTFIHSELDLGPTSCPLSFSKHVNFAFYANDSGYN